VYPSGQGVPSAHGPVAAPQAFRDLQRQPPDGRGARPDDRRRRSPPAPEVARLPLPPPPAGSPRPSRSDQRLLFSTPRATETFPGRTNPEPSHLGAGFFLFSKRDSRLSRPVRTIAKRKSRRRIGHITKQPCLFLQAFSFSLWVGKRDWLRPEAQRRLGACPPLSAHFPGNGRVSGRRRE